MTRAWRFRRAQAINALPDPPNRSATISPALLLLRSARSTSSTGFVGWIRFASKSYRAALERIRATRRGEQPIEPEDPFLLRDVATLLIDCGLRRRMVLKTGKMNGRGERIRTSGLLVPNQALYQAEPRPDDLQFSISERKPAKTASMLHADQQIGLNTQSVVARRQRQVSVWSVAGHAEKNEKEPGGADQSGETHGCGNTSYIDHRKGRG